MLIHQDQVNLEFNEHISKLFTQLWESSEDKQITNQDNDDVSNKSLLTKEQKPMGFIPIYSS